jgi:hypothetical protein
VGPANYFLETDICEKTQDCLVNRYVGKGSRSELALALAPYRNNAETCVTNKHLLLVYLYDAVLYHLDL